MERNYINSQIKAVNVKNMKFIPHSDSLPLSWVQISQQSFLYLMWNSHTFFISQSTDETKGSKACQRF